MKRFSLILSLWPVVAYSAGGLVEKVQETYGKTGSFRADFVQRTFIEVLEREVEEKGSLIFARSGRFLIHYQGSRERKYISDGRTLWIHHPLEGEVEVYEKAGDLLSREALVFLGGLGEMEKEFKVTENGSDRLTLIPRKKGSLFLKILLRVDPETGLVKEADLSSRSGNKSRYLFSSIRTNEPVSDGTFRYKK